MTAEVEDTALILPTGSVLLELRHHVRGEIDIFEHSFELYVTQTPAAQNKTVRPTIASRPRDNTHQSSTLFVNELPHSVFSFDSMSFSKSKDALLPTSKRFARSFL